MNELIVGVQVIFIFVSILGIILGVFFFIKGDLKKDCLDTFLLNCVGLYFSFHDCLHGTKD